MLMMMLSNVAYLTIVMASLVFYKETFPLIKDTKAFKFKQSVFIIGLFSMLGLFVMNRWFTAYTIIGAVLTIIVTGSVLLDKKYFEKEYTNIFGLFVIFLLTLFLYWPIVLAGVIYLEFNPELKVNDKNNAR